MSPVIRGPHVSKKANQSGVMETSFVFHITKDDSDVTLHATSDNEVNVSLLQSCLMEHVTWWNEWLGYFLSATAKHFSKPYTVQQIHKITKHTLTGTVPDTFPASIQFYPSMIEIRGGVFMVYWNYSAIPIIIDIPDLAEDDIEVDSGSMDVTGSLPKSSSTSGDMEEVNVDELPTHLTATEPIAVDGPGRFYDKHKLKEARLKAKIAMYKVQHQMARYYEKYGTEASDSEEEWSDASDSDGSEEVVQL